MKEEERTVKGVRGARMEGECKIETRVRMDALHSGLTAPLQSSLIVPFGVSTITDIRFLELLEAQLSV